MKRAVAEFCRSALCAAVFGGLALVATQAGTAQTKTYERTFTESAATIKKILQQMQGSMAGHLPVLDGFAVVGDHPPPGSYQRGYFQATVQVSPDNRGGTVVRVSTKVTAWYVDPVLAHSGYQLLESNGRIETDILDQISEQLAAASPGPSRTNGKAENPGPASDSAQSPIPVPAPQLPEAPGNSSASFSQSLAQQKAVLPMVGPKAADPDQTRLQSELKQLEEILKNQAHPKNLVAVKKSGTAVVAAPSLSAKPLFLASAHDEFEILDFNQDWVHVRISGLSRGWIWRDDLEMPGEIPDTQTAPAPVTTADMFRVVREEAAPFPGDWEALRGKTVQVISVQKADETTKDGSPQMRLEFAKYLFEKNYSDITQKSANLAGIVLIFDSSDGGMIAAPVSILEKWKAGTLSEAALWHACFFDPPESFLASGSSVSQ
jgi:hypothetical protein